MHEIKCPHCGKEFTVDESSYADILNQVRTKEFQKEVHEKLEQVRLQKEAEIELAKQKEKNDFDHKLALKDKELFDLKSKIEYKRSYCVSDFITDYNAYGGNAYGLANTLNQTAVLKPKIKNKKLKNLYYTGQLTVPGPGVPPSIISGKIVANEINRTQN